MKAGRVKRRRIRNKTGYDTQLIARLWTRVLRDYKNPKTDKPLTTTLDIYYLKGSNFGEKPGLSWHRPEGGHDHVERMIITMPKVVCPTIEFLRCLYYFATWGVWAHTDIPEFHKIAETYGYNLIDIPNRKKGY